MNDWSWLVEKLEAAIAAGGPVEERLVESAVAAIVDLQGTVAHLKENWEALIKAPEHPPEYVADVWLKNEQTERTIPYHEEWKMSGMRTRLASVIGRARVDGGMAAQNLKKA